ncbi:MAG: hypothetical protein QNL53_03080 [Microbacteriaceae bacterium]
MSEPSGGCAVDEEVRHRWGATDAFRQSRVMVAADRGRELG